jgi:hypothetical protein
VQRINCIACLKLYRLVRGALNGRASECGKAESHQEISVLPASLGPSSVSLPPVSEGLDSMMTKTEHL